MALALLADVLLHVLPPTLLLLVAAATAEEAPRGLADATTDAALRRNLMGGRVRWAGSGLKSICTCTLYGNVRFEARMTMA